MMPGVCKTHKAHYIYANAQDIVCTSVGTYYLVGEGFYKYSHCCEHPIRVRTTFYNGDGGKFCYHQFLQDPAPFKKWMQKRSLTSDEEESARLHDKAVFNDLHVVPLHWSH